MSLYRKLMKIKGKLEHSEGESTLDTKEYFPKKCSLNMFKTVQPLLIKRCKEKKNQDALSHHLHSL